MVRRVITFSFLVGCFVSAPSVCDAARALRKGEVPRGSPFPQHFTANRGQWPRDVLFLGHANGLSVRLHKDAIALRPVGSAGPAEAAAVRLVFEGARKNARATGVKKTGTASNFFLGKDPATWRTAVPSYEAVVYRDLYDGIDLRVRYNRRGNLEYDLELRPGADLHDVVIRCNGGTDIACGDDGELVMKTALGSIRQPVPKTWQVDSTGVRKHVACSYRVLDGGRFGFIAPQTVPELPLTVDPEIVWSTLHGGTGEDWGWQVAVTEEGAPIVVGFTDSLDFPGADGSFLGGGFDAFVVGFDPLGEEVRFCTYLGSTRDDKALDVALLPEGEILVAGRTGPADFPVTPGAFTTDHRGGLYDGFLVKLSPTGDELLYGTYLGGSGEDTIDSIDVDETGAVVMTGITQSINFPVTPGAFRETRIGGIDIHVSRMIPDEAATEQLLYATYLGGSGNEQYGARWPDQTIRVMNPLIVSLAPGTVVVAGATNSTDFPTKGGFQPARRGNFDAYITRLKLDATLPSGDQLEYSTYLGGGANEGLHALDKDANGDVVVAGWTWSGNFPTTPNCYQTSRNEQNDVYVSWVTPDASVPLVDQLRYSTYIGGANWEYACSLLAHEPGLVTVSVATGSSNFPVTDDAMFSTPQGGGFFGGVPGLFFHLDMTPGIQPAEQLVYSSFIPAAPVGFAEHPCRGLLVTGGTQSAGFPLQDPIQDSLAGSSDAFLLAIDLPPKAVFTATPESGAAPLAVEFDGSDSTTCEGATLTSYAWDFGDGGTAEGVAPSHTFDTPGRHIVIMTATDSLGFIHRAKRAVVVRCPTNDLGEWRAFDIGAPPYAGSSSREGDCFHICAGGEGLSYGDDQFHFLTREVPIDQEFSLIAHIAHWQYRTDTLNSAIGLHIRGGLNVGAAHAGVYLEITGGDRLERVRRRHREYADGPRRVETHNAMPSPLWLRLDSRPAGETGAEVVAYVSEDGEAWMALNADEPMIIDYGTETGIRAGVVGVGRDTESELEPFQAMQGTVCNLRVRFPGEFRRGDANGDDDVDIADPIAVLDHVFNGAGPPACADALDGNDDGQLDVADAITLLSHLFDNAGPLPAPFDACGADPTDDALGCDQFPPCAGR